MKYLLLVMLFVVFNCSNRKLLEGIFTYEATGIIYDCDENVLSNTKISFTDFDVETTTDEEGKWTLTASRVSTCENGICNFSIKYILNDNSEAIVTRTKAGFTLDVLKYTNNNINFYVNKNNSSVPCINDEHEPIIDNPVSTD